MDEWSNFIFSCAYDGEVEHGMRDIELDFTMMVDDEGLPANIRYLPYVYKMWGVNRLLNASPRACYTATGSGDLSTPNGKSNIVVHFNELHM